jgi:hypothetical protein
MIDLHPLNQNDLPQKLVVDGMKRMTIAGQPHPF